MVITDRNAIIDCYYRSKNQSLFILYLCHIAIVMEFE